MTNIPVEMEQVLEKLRQHPVGALHLELAMTQAALDNALERLAQYENAGPRSEQIGSVPSGNDGLLASGNSRHSEVS